MHLEYDINVYYVSNVIRDFASKDLQKSKAKATALSSR